MKLKGWFGVALVALAVIQAGCGEDSVCRGAIALSIFEDTAGVLKADGSLWTWRQFHESEGPKRELADAGATAFANGQMCLRLRSGEVSCPLLWTLGPVLPAHPREVAVWAEGRANDGVGACPVLADGTMTCAFSWSYFDTNVTFTTIREGVRNASIGMDHYCAITNDGGLACAPWNAALVGDLNAGGPGWTSAGAMLSGIFEVATTSGRWGGTVARNASGDVWWLQGDQTVSVDRVLGFDGPIVQLAAGPRAFCALRDDGAVFCWNDVDQGLLVPYNAVNVVPERIAIPKAATAIAMAPGIEFACALLEDTTVWCWGAGFNLTDGAYVAACG